MQRFLIILLVYTFFSSLLTSARVEYTDANEQMKAQRILSAQGLDSNDRGKFLYAIEGKYNDIVKAFVDAGDIDLNERYKSYTYLFVSVVIENYPAAFYLLENGASPALKTKDGGSPLFYAVKKNNTKLVEKMLETPGMNIRRHRMLFRAPLKTIAKRNGNTEIYNMLVDYDKRYKEEKRLYKQKL